MKTPNAISLRSSDDTTVPEDFTYRMRGNVILITYSGAIDKEIIRILQKIEYWHQGSIKAYRILYQDAEGIGGEVKWDGENAEVIPTR